MSDDGLLRGFANLRTPSERAMLMRFGGQLSDGDGVERHVGDTCVRCGFASRVNGRWFFTSDGQKLFDWLHERWSAGEFDGLTGEWSDTIQANYTTPAHGVGSE